MQPSWIKPADIVGSFDSGMELSLALQQAKYRKAQQQAMLENSRNRLEEQRRHNFETESLTQQLRNTQSEANVLREQIAATRDDNAKKPLQEKYDALKSHSDNLEKSLQSKMDMAGMRDATSRYGIDTRSQDMERGQDINEGLGMNRIAATERGQDITEGLGNRRIDASATRGDDTSIIGLSKKISSDLQKNDLTLNPELAESKGLAVAQSIMDRLRRSRATAEAVAPSPTFGSPAGGTTPEAAAQGNVAARLGAPAPSGKVADKQTLQWALQQSGGDVGKARALLQQGGFSIPPTIPQ